MRPKVGPILKRLSSVFVPIKGATKGDFPIWKCKPNPETHGGNAELYLFVAENKYWRVSSIFPENTNCSDIIIQSTTAISKSDIELARLAHARDAGRIADTSTVREKIDQSMTFTLWSLYDSDLYEEVSACLVPHSLWEPTKARCIVSERQTQLETPNIALNDQVHKEAR